MKKGNITGGLILILLGLWFLAVQFVPQLKIWAGGNWTLAIIGVAVIFLLVSLLNNIPGLSIPAFIIGGMVADSRICRAGFALFQLANKTKRPCKSGLGASYDQRGLFLYLRLIFGGAGSDHPLLAPPADLHRRLVDNPLALWDEKTKTGSAFPTCR